MSHKPLKTRRRTMSHKSTQIAIIIRTKDHPDLLTSCLQTLIDQKLLPDEVIIINDGGVFVSYLRYGAGMKGKLGQALSSGLPVVSTTIGAEGMGLVDAVCSL